MFKTSVVSVTFYFACALLITACGFSVPDAQTDLPVALKQAIAHELANASTRHWQDETGAVYVHSTPRSDWVREALTNELATRHYIVSGDPNEERQIEVATTNVGPDSVYVSLKIDKVRTLDRLFHFERSQPSDAARHRDLTNDDRDHSLPARQEVEAPVRQRTEPPRAPVEVTEAPQVSSFQTSNPDPVAVLKCGPAVLHQGSFKQSLQRILDTCGWHLAEWPGDPAKPNHELDWLVPTTQSLEFTSIEELVQALRVSFDLEIDLNRAAKTVRIQLR